MIFERWKERILSSQASSTEKEYLLSLNEEQLATYLYEKYYVGEMLSQKKIGKMFGCSNTVIFEMFGKYDFTIRKPVYGENFKHNNLYACDETYFDVIDQEDKAYWLGFMYADGYVGVKRKYRSPTVGLSIAERDKNHLEKLQGCLAATNPIKTYHVCGKQAYNSNSTYCRILFHSQHLHDQLVQKGCTEKKTNHISFPLPNIVPFKLQRHFIRGYFDGDGSIICCKNKEYHYAFCGTEKFLSRLMVILVNQNIISQFYKLNTRKEGQLTKEFKVGGNFQVVHFLDYIYKGATIYLDRKFALYQQITKEVQQSKEDYKYAHRHVCDICGTTDSSEFITWRYPGEFFGKRLCSRHYQQLHENRPIIVEKKEVKKAQCDLCGNSHSKKYYVWCQKDEYFNKTICLKHYYQLSTYGKITDGSANPLKLPLKHICDLCGKTDSSAYYHWHEEGSAYDGKELCYSHYRQLKQYGKPKK